MRPRFPHSARRRVGTNSLPRDVVRIPHSIEANHTASSGNLTTNCSRERWSCNDPSQKCRKSGQAPGRRGCVSRLGTRPVRGVPILLSPVPCALGLGLGLQGLEIDKLPEARDDSRPWFSGLSPEGGPHLPDSQADGVGWIGPTASCWLPPSGTLLDRTQQVRAPSRGDEAIRLDVSMTSAPRLRHQSSATSIPAPWVLLARTPGKVALSSMTSTRGCEDSHRRSRPESRRPSGLPAEDCCRRPGGDPRNGPDTTRWRSGSSWPCETPPGRKTIISDARGWCLCEAPGRLLQYRAAKSAARTGLDRTGGRRSGPMTLRVPSSPDPLRLPHEWCRLPNARGSKVLGERV
jgi:hypothetical protein